MRVFRNDYSLLVGALFIVAGIGFGLLSCISTSSAPIATTASTNDAKTQAAPLVVGDHSPTWHYMIGDGATVVTPNSTNFLNPDHIRDVPQYQVPDSPATNSAPGASSNSTPSYSTGLTTNAAPVFVPPNPLPAKPNWTWEVQDREFNNVVITKVEASSVSITCDSGPVKIDIAILPHELQKLLNYDPTAAGQSSAPPARQ